MLEHIIRLIGESIQNQNQIPIQNFANILHYIHSFICFISLIIFTNFHLIIIPFIKYKYININIYIDN